MDAVIVIIGKPVPHGLKTEYAAATVAFEVQIVPLQVLGRYQAFGPRFQFGINDPSSAPA